MTKEEKVFEVLVEIIRSFMDNGKKNIEDLEKEIVEGLLAKGYEIEEINDLLDSVFDLMNLDNPLMDAISDCFPKELALGRYCVAEIYQRLGVELRGDEAGFIAMHIINARLGTKMEQIQDITKMVNSCAEIADACLAGKINKNSVAYERFLVHLKYLAKRLFKSQELPNVLSRDEEFTDIIKKKFKKQYKCAKHMQDHILKNYAKTISEDEMITLSIHLKKISG
jgi:beta-glucoside operon transcriptional antiterminator